MVCAIPGEAEEGKRRHHIMANHGDIQPALSNYLSVAALGRRAGGSIFEPMTNNEQTVTGVN